MILLQVLGSDDNSEIIARNIKPLGFELIRYRHVAKAMDNIDEINPTAIIISAKDFPRHWKILVQFVRSERPKEICPIIILKSRNFSIEETSKAFFLGVNGVVDDSLVNPGELDRLQNILSHCMPVQERRKHHRFFVEPWHRIGFIIANLSGRSIVNGEVKTISAGGLSFYPETELSLPDELILNEFHECSLRVGDAILSPVCRLIRTGRIFAMEFVVFPKDERRILEQYLTQEITKQKPSENFLQ